MKGKIKNMLNTFAWILLTFITVDTVVGQSINKVDKDSLLNYPITVLEQGEIKNVVFGDLTRELHILYFWSTYCAPCMRKLPVLDSLQQVYTKELAILPVAREKCDRIFSVFDNSERLKNMKFKVGIDGADFSNLFPHRGVPHVVWLDRDMNVLAITNEKAISEEIILRMIADKNYQIPEVYLKK